MSECHWLCIPSGIVQELQKRNIANKHHSILMTGTSPFTGFQSPSFHSSSYLPKLEANFMRDFSCCGVTLPTLHDLLQHYEEAHATKSPHQGHRPSQGESRAALAAAAIAHQQSQQNNGQNRGLQPDKIMDMQRKLSHPQPSHHHPDLDTIDDMELDEPMGDSDSPSNLFSPPPQSVDQSGFGNSSRPHLNCLCFRATKVSRAPSRVPRLAQRVLFRCKITPRYPPSTRQL